MNRGLLAVLTLVMWAGACSSDDNGVNITCSDNELYDQVNDSCVPRGMQQPDVSLPDAGNDATATNNDTNTTTEDMGDDAEVDMSDPNCDRDNDRAQALSCGGNDCDDLNPYRSPNLPEFCDDIDNDCSGTVNNDIDCSFFAHSDEKFYKIDPFAKTATPLDMSVPTDTSALQDIDTHPDGTLYGVSSKGLYRYDKSVDRWNKVGDFGIDVGDPNGMAIDLGGTVLVTSKTKVYTVDTETGAATELGDMMGDFYSSGDCVVNKYDTLYMTSKKTGEDDTLVLINRETGIGEERGSVGFKKVFGLTAAWGKLWGLTSQGELITIDDASNDDTNKGSLVTTFPDISFFGAASTPSR